MNHQTSSVPPHARTSRRPRLSVKTAWDLILATVAISFFAFALLAEGAVAQEEATPVSSNQSRLEKKLLRASEGVQYPGSESDSTWTFVSYPSGAETELPDARRFEEISGCPVTPDGSTTRQDFDATFDRLTGIEEWMDTGQVRSAKGFRKIERVMLRSYEERAVYRCDTAAFGQVYYYFVGLDEPDGISGLLTVSTET